MEFSLDIVRSLIMHDKLLYGDLRGYISEPFLSIVDHA